MKDPCKDCVDKETDEYGWLCDIPCGRHSQYLNYKAGIKEVIEFIKQECQEDLQLYSGESIVCIPTSKWQAKCNEWGVE